MHDSPRGGGAKRLRPRNRYGLRRTSGAVRLLPILALVLALAPLAAAQEDIRFERQLTLTTPGSAALRLVFIYEGANATFFRELADADGDGRVSAAERSANEAPFADQVRSDEPFGWSMDGFALVWRGGGSAHSRGLEGPVGQAGLVVVTVEGGANLEGPLPDAARHNLTRATLPHEALPTQETVRAPPGWRFVPREDVAVRSDPCTAALTPGERGEETWALVRDERACPGDPGPAVVPGPGGAALLLALAAVALLAARRR